jgi:hypothetical protein
MITKNAALIERNAKWAILATVARHHCDRAVAIVIRADLHCPTLPIHHHDFYLLKWCWEGSGSWKSGTWMVIHCLRNANVAERCCPIRCAIGKSFRETEGVKINWEVKPDYFDDAVRSPSQKAEVTYDCGNEECVDHEKAMQASGKEQGC